MMQTRTALILLFGFAGALSASHAAASDPQSARPHLSGTWNLNKELSESPGEKMMEAMRGAGGQGGRGMGGRGGAGGGGMGGRGGGGGRPGGAGGMGGGAGRGPGGPGGVGGGLWGGEPPLDGAPVADRPREAEARDGQGHRRARGPVPSPQFTIEQEGDNVVFRTESNLRILHSDGQKRKKKGEGGKLVVTTKFVKGALIIESRPERGGKRKETYTLRPNGKIEIDFEMDGSGQMPALRFKLVYDTAPVA